MTTILPAILAKDEAEFIAQVAAVRSLGLPLHIDVMDGAFVPNVTYAPLERVHHLVDGLPFEVHLMVANPEHAVPEWIAGGAERVIFHVETTVRGPLICRATADDCKKLVIALNPETTLAQAEPFLQVFERVLLMGVTPGLGGQPLQSGTAEKIRELRAKFPKLGISVDGGVKPENCAELVAAGADMLVAGSAIVGAPAPAEALLRFRTALHE